MTPNAAGFYRRLGQKNQIGLGIRLMLILKRMRHGDSELGHCLWIWQGYPILAFIAWKQQFISWCPKRLIISLKKVQSLNCYTEKITTRTVSLSMSLNLIRAMYRSIPKQLQDKVASMPEYSYGAKRVIVTLDDGTKVQDVFIAWSKEIVKVGTSKNIPFDPMHIVDVENQ